MALARDASSRSASLRLSPTEARGREEPQDELGAAGAEKVDPLSPPEPESLGLERYPEIPPELPEPLLWEGLDPHEELDPEPPNVELLEEGELPQLEWPLEPQLDELCPKPDELELWPQLELWLELELKLLCELLPRPQAGGAVPSTAASATATKIRFRMSPNLIIFAPPL